MSAIEGVGATQSNTQQTSASMTRASEELGTSQFLQLLVTQLQNQDPMNPMDNQQFITQLASFSSLEQLMSINQGVSKLTAALEETETANA
jgi:flagellar basal-body rod modification protein FlgD